MPDGKTLGELNLRGLTGATVVAIDRGNNQIIYPSGSERLEGFDLIALSGTVEAVQAAEQALTAPK